MWVLTTILILALVIGIALRKKKIKRNPLQKEIINEEDKLADYGIIVNGIDIQKNKVIGLYAIHQLESGKNYDIHLPSGGYFTIIDKFSTAAISENWNTRYTPSKKESFHKISIDRNIIKVRWVTEVSVHPFLPMFIYIWR
ncbi:hypothetical protein [Mannheimia varigena]|uniref:hypothetical protein n=1 Tax=Mannheimia varigena TaxID=85404 RepID=UPI0011057B15|nr:hypothetical protein [Mannheimia varigena]TLU75344.1 hypothetical protein FE589_08535 [Mannheimia varigena]